MPSRSDSAASTASSARKQVVAEFEALGLLVRSRAAPPRRRPLLPLRHGRGAAPLRPVVRARWRRWPSRALAAYRDGKLRFIPEHPGRRATRTWMENIRDWCISRQLWWGHRIPVWYCDANRGGMRPDDRVARSTRRRCPGCGGALRQDEDVLDTWFSSWLVPVLIARLARRDRRPRRVLSGQHAWSPRRRSFSSGWRG